MKEENRVAEIVSQREIVVRKPWETPRVDLLQVEDTQVIGLPGYDGSMSVS